MLIRTIDELMDLPTFEERFDYLQIGGSVGRATFGFDRYLNQRFYTSKEWKDVRNEVIARDLGLDLAMPGHEIYDKVIVHHMNPISMDALIHNDRDVLNPDHLITTTHNTHNAIHYGDRSLLPATVISRRPGDTKLW